MNQGRPSAIKLAMLDCAQMCLRTNDPNECAKEYGARLLDTGRWELADVELVVEGAIDVVALLNSKDR